VIDHNEYKNEIDIFFVNAPQEKSHSRKRMAFFNEAHLRCMKNEARLLLHIREANASFSLAFHSKVCYNKTGKAV
jgi:hypothetical protein